MTQKMPQLACESKVALSVGFIPGKNPKRSENGERRRLRDLSVPDSLLRLHRTAWK